MLAAALVAAFGVSAVQASAASLPAGSTAILSGAPSLLEALPAPAGNSEAGNSSVSSDGRYVAFSSSADGLSDADDDYVSNVYVEDRATGAVTLVSRASGPDGEPTHDSCYEPAISDNGMTVAFICSGPLSAADDNGVSDVYARRLDTDATILVSRAGGLGPVGNASSSHPALSADGTLVAFDSYSKNLVPDANSNTLRIYRRRIGGDDATIVVSRRDGAAGVIDEGGDPSISDDGNRIAFTSDSNLVTADNNSFADVYVREVSSGVTFLASRAPGLGAVGNGQSYNGAIAGDGSAVAFESYTNNFAYPDDIDTEADIYWRDLTGSTNQQNTALVSVNAAGQKGHNSTAPSIDSSGDVVAFESQATGLDPADTSGARDAYVKNVMTNTLEIASRADGNSGEVANAGVNAVSVSGDGTKVAVSMPDGRLVPGVDPRAATVIMRDLSAKPRTTSAVSRPAGTDPFVNQGGESDSARLSADGRYAVFVTGAPALLPDGVNEGVVVRDRVTGAITFASRAENGDPMTDHFYSPAISADGHRVAFQAVPPGGPAGQVWVRDLAEGKTFLASRADGQGGAAGNDASQEPALDADGSRVAFVSQATNLGDGDADSNDDVHVRDLATDQTLLVSRADGAGGAKGDDTSYGPDINGDGTRVSFVSQATNLGDGDTDNRYDVHLRDLSTDKTVLVSATADGEKSNNNSRGATIDLAGQRVAFDTTATNLPGGGQPGDDVLVRDLSTGSLVLASRADGADGAPADGDASNGTISPDGGYVAFTSYASNLAASAPTGVGESYRRDLAAGRTDLVSRHNGADGAPVARDGYAEDISAGGGCVAFKTSDALLGPSSELFQVYVRVLRADCAARDAAGGGGTQNGGGGGVTPRDTTPPVLSRVRLAHKRVRVGRRHAVRFRSSEAGTLTTRVERRVKRGKRVRYRLVGTLKQRIRAGAGRVALKRRIGKRRLVPGRYRVSLVARDAAGNRSKRVRRTFTVVRG